MDLPYSPPRTTRRPAAAPDVCIRCYGFVGCGSSPQTQPELGLLLCFAAWFYGWAFVFLLNPFMIWVLATTACGKRARRVGCGLVCAYCEVVEHQCLWMVVLPRGGRLRPRGKPVVSITSGKHLFPRVVGVELVKSLASKELRVFSEFSANWPPAHGRKRRQNFPPFTDVPYVVGLCRAASIGSEYSRKERKSYSVRKACWILPLLWGQMIIWSQLGVSWSCVSLHQPRSCPLVRPMVGLGSSSPYCETRRRVWVWVGFLSVLSCKSSFRAACACRSLEKKAVLGARCEAW